MDLGHSVLLAIVARRRDDLPSLHPLIKRAINTILTISIAGISGAVGTTFINSHDNSNAIHDLQKSVNTFIEYQSKRDAIQDSDIKSLLSKVGDGRH